MCNLKAMFPKHIAYVTHNQTVNIDGRPGHGKPLDLMQEHYNLYVHNQLCIFTVLKFVHYLNFRVIKQALKSSGSNCTPHHTQDILLCGLRLLKVMKKADHEISC